MPKVLLKGRFTLDPSRVDSVIKEWRLSSHAKETGKGEAIAEIIAMEVASKAGGFSVTPNPTVETPDEFHIAVKVPELVAKFYAIAPDVVSNELLSPENRALWAVTSFKIDIE
jgi:hypothetical protein